MLHTEKEVSRRYWTTKEVAAKLGVSPNTVITYTNKSNLQVKVIRTRVRRYTSTHISKLRRLIKWLNQAK